MPAPKKLIELNFLYDEDDIYGLYRLQKFFIRYSSKNGYRLPPAKVYDAFLSRLISQATIVDALIEQYVAETLTYFRKIDGYEFQDYTFFHKENPDLPEYAVREYSDIPFDSGEVFSFEKMIVAIYHRLLSQDTPFSIKDKKKIVTEIYQWTDEYISHVLAENDFSHYRKTVVSAFVASRFGLFPKQDECDEPNYTGFLFSKAHSITDPHKRTQ